jgi:hypothetical protein
MPPRRVTPAHGHPDAHSDADAHADTGALNNARNNADPDADNNADAHAIPHDRRAHELAHAPRAGITKPRVSLRTRSVARRGRKATGLGVPEKAHPSRGGAAKPNRKESPMTVTIDPLVLIVLAVLIVDAKSGKRVRRLIRSVIGLV